MRDTALLGFAAAFGLSLVSTLAMRTLARRIGLVAQPRADRWHRRPTALLGGLAIAIGFSVPVLALGSFHEVGPIAALAAIVTGLGLADDIRRLNPAAKLVLEAIAAAGALSVGYRLGWTGSLTVDSLLTIIWLVGLANAFNLLDNMDGLAAGVAGIGASAYLVLAFMHGNAADVLMLSAYAGATCGFLVFNFQPASIFMGDAGSLFLGFTLALLAVRSGAGLGAAGTASIVIPLAILAVPIFDTTFVTFARSLAGRRVSVGGRDHSSHRLVALGLPERRAVLVLYTFAGLAGFAGLSAYYLDLSHANVLLGLFLAVLTLFGLHLAQVHVYEGDASPPDLPGTVAIALKVESRTRLLDVLLDVCVVTLAYYTAYRIRFDDVEFVEFFPLFLRSLPIVVATTITSLWWTGADPGIWRYFGAQDAIVVLKGTALATVCSVTAMSYFFRFEGYSRAVFAICGALTFVLLSAGRASFRFVHELTGNAASPRRRVVIYGVGDAGLAVLRETRADRIAVHVVGFVDDDPATHDRSVQGVRVLGGLDAILELVRRREVEGVLVSSAGIGADRLDVLRPTCRESGVFLLRFRWVFQNLLAGERQSAQVVLTIDDPTHDQDEVTLALVGDAIGRTSHGV